MLHKVSLDNQTSLHVDTVDDSKFPTTKRHFSATIYNNLTKIEIEYQFPLAESIGFLEKMYNFIMYHILRNSPYLQNSAFFL